VELLVVVAIIALLVSILLPSLSRAKALAKKSMCAQQLHSLGSAGAMYVSLYDSYPFDCVPGISIVNGPGYDYECYWPKVYGIFGVTNVKGTQKTNFGTWAYLQEPDEIVASGMGIALCPGMDAKAIWTYNRDKCFNTPDGFHEGKPEFHKGAIGYQWNTALRSAVPNRSYYHCGVGRWNPRVESYQGHATILWSRTDINLYVPTDSDMLDWQNGWVCQAVRPDEIRSAGTVAEAWDSHDMATTPGIVKSWPTWWTENLIPGGHAGPFSRGNAWAALNGLRHSGSPNILYADGHVSADATRPLKPADLGSCSYGSWNDATLTSWPDRDPKFGSLNHIAPVCEFLGN
jgi:prepilin-type processing-associated H-X9-DG protein